MDQSSLPVVMPWSQVIATKQVELNRAKRAKKGRIAKAQKALVRAQAAKLRAELAGPDKTHVRPHLRALHRKGQQPAQAVML